MSSTSVNKCEGLSERKGVAWMPTCMFKQAGGRWRTADALASFMRLPPTEVMKSQMPRAASSQLRLEQLQVAKSHLNPSSYVVPGPDGLNRKLDQLKDVTPLDAYGNSMLQGSSMPPSLFRGVRSPVTDLGQSGKWVHGTPSPDLATIYGVRAHNTPSMIAEYTASPSNRYSADFFQDTNLIEQVGRTWNKVVAALRQPAALRPAAFGMPKYDYVASKLRHEDPGKLLAGSSLDASMSTIPWYETKLQSGVNAFKNWAFVRDNKLLRVPDTKPWQHIVRNITAPVHGEYYAARIPQAMSKFMGAQGYESLPSAIWFKIRSAVADFIKNNMLKKTGAGTDREPSRSEKVAWLGNLAKNFGTTALVGSGYHAADVGLRVGDRWVDNRYLQDSGQLGPYIPGHVPQIPSQMSFGGRSNTPMSGVARIGAEGIDTARMMLNADGNAFMASNPGALKMIAPLILANQMYKGVPMGQAVKGLATGVAPAIAPAAVAGSIMQTFRPSWKPLRMGGMGGTLMTGLATGVALKGTEMAHQAFGVGAPDDFMERINEPAINRHYRGFNSLAAGASAGALVTKGNPFGIVSGAITGALVEPDQMRKDLNTLNAIGDRQEVTNWIAGAHNLSDPRIPLDRIGNLNAIPTVNRDELLELRHQRAVSGVWDVRPKPRSTWKHNTPGQDIPEFESIPAGQRPSEMASAEINDPRLKGSPMLDSMKTKINLHPHLAIGGGILAAGLGAYGLRKLFGKKEEEDKPGRTGYASPQITTPDRWVIA